MTTIAEATLSAPVAAPDTGTDRLTPRQLAILAGYAVILWLFALGLIHFRGPAGIFEGLWHAVLYALTIPVTMYTNASSRRWAGLPKSRTLEAVAVTSLVALFMDGVAFGFFPALYSTDPHVALSGAAWLLWAIAVALVLALVSSTDADARA